MSHPKTIINEIAADRDKLREIKAELLAALKVARHEFEWMRDNPDEHFGFTVLALINDVIARTEQ
jgi:hypothetical protein